MRSHNLGLGPHRRPESDVVWKFFCCSLPTGHRPLRSVSLQLALVFCAGLVWPNLRHLALPSAMRFQAWVAGGLVRIVQDEGWPWIDFLGCLIAVLLLSYSLSAAESGKDSHFMTMGFELHLVGMHFQAVSLEFVALKAGCILDASPTTVDVICQTLLHELCLSAVQNQWNQNTSLCS